MPNTTEPDYKSKDWVFLNYTYKRFEGLTQRGSIPSYMKSGKLWVLTTNLGWRVHNTQVSAKSDLFGRWTYPPTTCWTGIYSRKICRNRIPYDYRTVLAEPAGIFLFFVFPCWKGMGFKLSCKGTALSIKSYQFLSEHWAQRVCSSLVTSFALWGPEL